ncbi:MAG TPA: hypothetical protein VH061_11525 [Solirubrobacteraceae bacterium]|jgi:hypothetical protein|nr:hypothetical protein [Solirubrobacteraceae bacterium]
MNLPAAVRVSVNRIALLGAATLSLGLFAPVHASAASAGRAEERAARAEERSTRRAQRHQEAEARHQLRAEERASRHGARRNDVAPEGSEGSAPTGEPSARSYRGCSVTLAAGSPHVIAGETVQLTGTLTCPSSTEASTPTVAVYQRDGGLANHDLAAPSNVSTLPDGSFTMTSKPLEANTVFQVQAGRHRARVAVKVAPTITLSLSTPDALASRNGSHRTRTVATFTGTLTPAAPGALVALQIAYAGSGERWHSVAFGHVTAEGTYTIPHVFKSPGAANVRAIVHTGRGHAVGISEAIPYLAGQPQNPQLTIESSADPVVSGQPVTISGVAAGAASTPVKLLASVAGGPFLPVDEATTEAGGIYGFTETPLESTVYRVSDATTRSTSLFEGIAFALTSEAPPSTAAVGTPVTFAGTATPATEGQLVHLEQRYASGVRFHTIATGTVGASSQYSIEHAFASAGTVTLRITVPSDGHRVATSGAPFTVAVS